MVEEKTSRIKDIKETVSGAVEIMRQIRNPGVPESFGRILDTAAIAREIIEALRTPEMVKNIENLRLISENMNKTATKIQDVTKYLEETGVINEATRLIRSTKTTIDSFSDSGQDLHEMSTAVKEIFKSTRALVDELRVIVTS
jgi:DNA repair ATPase RecN